MSSLKTQLAKEFGASKIQLGSESPQVERLSSGSVGLDFALGGGYPRGGIVEIFGAESMGKTTLAYYAIAEEQKLGNMCAFINLEGQFNPDWAQTVAGVELERLIVANPDHGDEAAEMLSWIVNAENSGGERISLIVFDSIGAMLSAKEAGEDGVDRVGGQSKLITGMVKRALVPAVKNRTTVVFLNQIRDVMNSMGYAMVESPGGHALKHAAVQRVQLKPGKERYSSVVNGQKKEIGQRITAVVKKNKAGSPKASASWDFIHDEVPERPLGIDRVAEVRDLAIQFELIAQSGGNYSHPTFPLDDKGRNVIRASEGVKGIDVIYNFLTKNPETLAKLREELMTLARRNGGLEDGSSEG